MRHVSRIDQVSAKPSGGLYGDGTGYEVVWLGHSQSRAFVLLSSFHPRGLFIAFPLYSCVQRFVSVNTSSSRTMRPITNLTSLPPEMLSVILRLACSDGGRTARSLQLTCKALVIQARLHRFRTVYLSGFAKLDAFLRVIEQENLDSSRAQHLFISSHVMDEDYVPDPPLELVGKTTEDEDWMTEAQTWGFQPKHRDIVGPSFPDFLPPDFHDSVARIVNKLRARLQSLVVVTYGHPLSIYETRWEELPQLHTFRLYFMEGVREIKLSLTAPALRTFTLGVAGGLLMKHNELLYQFISTCPLLRTLALEGFIINIFLNVAQLQFLLGHPVTRRSERLIPFHWRTLNRFFEIIQVSGLVQSMTMGWLDIHDLLRQVQQMEAAGLQLGSIRPGRLSSQVSLPALCGLKGNWLGELESLHMQC
jgi:hypothetical protein